jgi:hypothetical protein
MKMQHKFEIVCRSTLMILFTFHFVIHFIYICSRITFNLVRYNLLFEYHKEKLNCVKNSKSNRKCGVGWNLISLSCGSYLLMITENIGLCGSFKRGRYN